METVTPNLGRQQIHIISAGKSMNDTFAQVLRKYRVDGVIIFREKKEESRLDSKEEKDIDGAAKELFEMAKRLKLYFEEVSVPQNSINVVRNEILRIREQFRNADIFFNITHGKKVIPLYLFTMAVWIDGRPYYVEKKGEILEFNIPRMHAEEISENENLFRILSILHETAGDSGRRMSYRELFIETSEEYTPSKPSKPGRPSKLPMGTFSKWLRKLIESNLIREEFDEGSNKRKMLYLTDDGIFTYEFFQRQKRN